MRKPKASQTLKSQPGAPVNTAEARRLAKLLMLAPDEVTHQTIDRLRKLAAELGG